MEKKSAAGSRKREVFLPLCPRFPIPFPLGAKKWMFEERAERERERENGAKKVRACFARSPASPYRSCVNTLHGRGKKTRGVAGKSPRFPTYFPPTFQLGIDSCASVEEEEE